MSRQPHTIPASPPPGFGRQFSEMLAQHGANHSNSTAALLDARSDALGHILSNVERIANVGGGAQSPDRLLGAFAGAQGPMIGGPYAEAMDRLRLAQAQADVNATNRSGSGGGGANGSSPRRASAGEWIVRNTDTGEITRFDPTDLDDAMISNMMGSGSIEVLRYGAPLDEGTTGPWDRSSTGSTANNSPAASNNGNARQTFEDGSYIENGVAYDANGNRVGG